MHNALEIRQAAKADAGKIAEIERMIFSDAWSKEDYEKLLEGPAMKFYIAEDAGELIGYGGYACAADEADIIDIGIRKDRQGEKIGSRLLAYMLDDLKGKRVFLEVRESNAPAIGLYKKFGFQKIGMRKNYYDHPEENAVVMFKKERKS